MHWKNLSNYDYLGAYSIDGVASELVLTIKDIRVEEVTGVGGIKDKCIVAVFEETDVGGIEIKPMILNKTNCKAIEKALGTGDVLKWVGKKITIFVTTTKYQRDIVPCLRVKDVEPVVKCSVCGKDIDTNLFNLSIIKYGKAFCSKECKEKEKE